MELRHLRYFVMVAEELHFGRAALRLNIAQPALSQQIRQLENELGFLLFERDKHRVELTSPGRVFLDEARLILIHVQQAQDAAQRAHLGASGRIVLGFVGSATYHIVPLLHTYRAQFPLVHIVLQQMKTTEQLQALHEKRLDVGVLRRASMGASNEMNLEMIKKEEFIVAMPSHHRLAAKESVSMYDLAEEPFILTPFQSGSSYYEAVIRCCYEAGFRPNVVLEAPEILTIVAFVAAGMGIALVPESFRSQQNIGVTYRKLQNTSPLLELSLAWRKNEHAQVVSQLINTIRSSINDA